MERGADRREDHWFDELADFLGPAYLRNAFTKRKARRRRAGRCVHVVAVATLVLVGVAGCGSDAARSLSVRAACKELSRRTLTSTPVGSDSASAPTASFDPEAKKTSRVARDIAPRARSIEFRRALLKLADVSDRREWRSREDWLAEPAMSAVADRCRPLLRP